MTRVDDEILLYFTFFKGSLVIVLKFDSRYFKGQVPKI